LGIEVDHLVFCSVDGCVHEEARHVEAGHVSGTAAKPVLWRGAADGGSEGLVGSCAKFDHRKHLWTHRTDHRLHSLPMESRQFACGMRAWDSSDRRTV